MLQLSQSKELRHKLKQQVGIFNLMSEFFQTMLNDFRMIKSNTMVFNDFTFNCYRRASEPAACTQKSTKLLVPVL